MPKVIISLEDYTVGAVLRPSLPRDGRLSAGVARNNRAGMRRFSRVAFRYFHPSLRARVAEAGGRMDSEWTKPIIRTQSAAKMMHTLNHSLA